MAVVSMPARHACVCMTIVCDLNLFVHAFVMVLGGWDSCGYTVESRYLVHHSIGRSIREINADGRLRMCLRREL